MSNSKLSRWSACLLLALACCTASAKKESTEIESSRDHQQRISLRHRDYVAPFASDGRRGPSWDDSLQMSATGSRKDKKINDRNNDDDDDKKTLSQQVKEGKYGLIQDEIFAHEPKRPGVVSYSSNSDIPKDTIKNFGGLDEDEIWLAENHVLVLKGGKLPEGEQNLLSEEKWPPIDNFQAPNRPVKIPSKPKVPPPFPVQLTDGGPIKILASEDDKVSQNAVNMTFTQGFLPGEGPFFPLFANNSAPFMPALSFVPVNSSKGTLQFKPIIIPDRQFNLKLKPQNKNEEVPTSPMFPGLPPGAVIVPPPANRSDYDDEEDQSIYYPPPYSFVYDVKNDSTDIPPGPLVPGIILPPPPDFFSPLDDDNSAPNTKDKYRLTEPINVSFHSTVDFKPHSSVSRKPPSTKLYKNGPTTITSAPKSTTTKTPRKSTVSRYSAKTSLRKPINNTAYVPRTLFVEVTTPAPAIIKPANYDIDNVVSNQVSETSTEKNWNAVVSSKPVPLLATFYTTTTPAPPKEQQIETTPATGKQRIPDQASFYFYGESNNESPSSPGSNSQNNVYFTPTSTESSTSYYKGDQYSQKPEDAYFNRVEEPQPQRPNSIKLLDNIVQDPRVYQYTETSAKDHTKVQTNPASSLYVSTISADRPRNSYIKVTPEPPSSVYYQDPQINVLGYDQKSKSKPIYQYSFEAAEYNNKDRKIGKKKKQQAEREISYQYPEREVSPTIHQSSFEQLRYPFKSHKPVEYYGPTTIRSPVDVSTTLEPHRVYITKQDEQLLDDVTKEYFTMFGKKLGGKRVQSTTPIYKISGVTEKPKYSYATNEYTDPGHYKVPNVKLHYGVLSSISRPPFSLQGDTLVNYKHPLPSIHPDGEYITVVNPERTRTGKVAPQPIVQEEFQARQVLQAENQLRDYGGQQILQQSHQQNQNGFIPMEAPRSLGQKPVVYPNRPISLANDEAVNYNNPRPPINPDAEYITPVARQPINRYRNKANSYFAYNLPGDGGHFYFLTPQALPQRQPNPTSYLYSNPRVSRLVRRRRGPA